MRVFDGTQLTDADSVVLDNGTIAAVGRGIEPPPGATIHDGGGGTLLPGLIDSHAHVRERSQLGDSLRFGVTAVLDMFTPDLALMRRLGEQRDDREPTEVADLWSAGTLVTAPGGHPTQARWSIPVLAPGDDADQFVADRQREGSDYIKIVIDDGAIWGGDLPTLTADQVRAVVDAAHSRGLLAVVHADDWDAAATAAAAGADLLAHAPITDLGEQNLIAEVAGAGTAVVATLGVMAAPACVDDGPDLRDDPDIGPYLTDDQRRDLDFEAPTCFHGTLSTTIDNVRALHRAGVPILAGSDFPTNGMVPGASLLLELELLVRAGLDPVDALAGATGHAAERFRLDDRGRIASEMRADLVLVREDPTADILAVRDITGIWKNGHLVTRDPP